MLGRTPQRQGARTGNEAMTRRTGHQWWTSARMRTHSSSTGSAGGPQGCRARQRGKRCATISGERKLEKEEQGKKFHRMNVRMAALCAALSCLTTLIRQGDGFHERRRAGSAACQGRAAKPKQIEISVN